MILFNLCASYCGSLLYIILRIKESVPRLFLLVSISYSLLLTPWISCTFVSVINNVNISTVTVFYAWVYTSSRTVIAIALFAALLQAEHCIYLSLSLATFTVWVANMLPDALLVSDDPTK